MVSFQYYIYLSVIYLFNVNVIPSIPRTPVNQSQTNILIPVSRM